MRFEVLRRWCGAVFHFAEAGLAVVDGRLAVSRAVRRYTLAELLAASDYSTAQPAEDCEWVDAAPVDREAP